MRQKVTKIIRNVLRERAITVIGALSPCAIYPRNNVKRDIMHLMYSKNEICYKPVSYGLSDVSPSVSKKFGVCSPSFLYHGPVSYKK